MSTHVISVPLKLRIEENDAGQMFVVARDASSLLGYANYSAFLTAAHDKRKMLVGDEEADVIPFSYFLKIIFSSDKDHVTPLRDAVTGVVQHALIGGNGVTANHAIPAPQYGQVPTRFGRQPFMDIIRDRGISQGNALAEMNALNLPSVPQINSTYQDQIRGAGAVRPALALRASAWLNLPVEELFTEESRSRLPQPGRVTR